VIRWLDGGTMVIQTDDRIVIHTNDTALLQ
jgi:hypothetical protein